MLERSPNATRLMDKLCAKNYIERLPSEHDRRVVKIVITKEGKELLESIPKNLNKDLLKNIDEDEAKQLSDLLDKMR
jgi:DNA-binding MarR family transcriptional regulator